VRAESEGFFDEVTVHRIQAGKDAVVAILTNEAITLPASSTGVISTYTGASGFFNVFNGTTDVTSSATKTVQDNPQSLTVTGPNATTGAWSITGGFDSGENTATLTFRSVYGGVTIDKTVFLTKAFTGATGEAGDDGTNGTNGTNGDPGAPGPALFTLVGANATSFPTPNSVLKTSGGGVWTGAAASAQGFPSAFVSARANQLGMDAMFGLSTNPAASTSYTTINYAWHFTASNQLLIYELGINQGSFGTYTTSTVPLITYDGHMVRYILNGTVVRSVPVLGLTLYLDISLYTLGFLLSDITFGPMGKSGDLQAQLIFLETWEHQSVLSYWAPIGATSATITYPQNGRFGGRVLSVAGNEQTYVALEAIPFDPNTLYKVTVAVRRTVAAPNGQHSAYLGLATYTATNNTNPLSYMPEWNWNVMVGENLGAYALNQWVEFTGYICGTQAGTAAAVRALGVDTPTPLPNGTAYFRPYLILNYSAGNGTSECDYIRVERLNNPDDADNTDKRRIVPDAEFELGQLGVYWFAPVSAPGVSLSTSGGLVGGAATFTGNGALQRISSKRNPSLQATIGSSLTITMRWKRVGSVNLTLTAYSVRHNASDGLYDPEIATVAVGGIRLTAGEINARADGVWQEDVATVALATNPPFLSGIVMPYVAVSASISGASGTIVIDYLNLTFGPAAFIPRIIYNASRGLDLYDCFHYVVHDAGSAGDYTLPQLSIGNVGALIGAKVYLEQSNVGSMRILPPSGYTLRSSPGRTDSRFLSGRSARALAEYTDVGVWTLVGDLL
jgi:hypothetical protein